jgi:hypothetical protein
MKWIKYTIDCNCGKTVLYTRKRPKDTKKLFYELADQCFGIRKSIGKTKVLSEGMVALPTMFTPPKDNNISRHPELYESPRSRLIASMPS